MRVAMIGATGLVGQLLAPRLVAAGYRLTLLGRRAADVAGAEEVVAPVAAWSEALGRRAFDVAISTLGTTRKAAGSDAAFVGIDRDAVLAFFAAARAAGARHALAVSSVGAGGRGLYLRTKGEMEAGLARLAFARVDIARPGLLIGARAERRLAEGIAQRAARVTDALIPTALDRYRSIPADTLAAALAALVGQAAPGTFVHHGRDLRHLAFSGAAPASPR